jgi:hypothetical protein
MRRNARASRRRCLLNLLIDALLHDKSTTMALGYNVTCYEGLRYLQMKLLRQSVAAGRCLPSPGTRAILRAHGWHYSLRKPAFPNIQPTRIVFELFSNPITSYSFLVRFSDVKQAHTAAFASDFNRSETIRNKTRIGPTAPQGLWISSP